MIHLISFVVHHDKGLFSGDHATTMVLGADKNWYNINDFFVFFAGKEKDLETSPSIELFVYEKKDRFSAEHSVRP